MEIERVDGTKEKREYPNAMTMITAAAIMSLGPKPSRRKIRKLILHFPEPKLVIPGRRRKP